jgi:predicted acetyltransferase
VADFSFHQYVKHSQNGRSITEISKTDGVPRVEFWLIENDKYLGFGMVRKIKSGSNPKIASHIYYEIVPSCRGRGYGMVLFQKLICKARLMGISPVIVSVNDQNAASKHIIERCGGVRKKTVVLTPKVSYGLYEF